MDEQINSLLAMGAEFGFYLLVLIFVFHALFLGYHWLSYGASRAASMSALAIYLCGGALILLSLSYIVTTF